MLRSLVVAWGAFACLAVLSPPSFGCDALASPDVAEPPDPPHGGTEAVDFTAALRGMMFDPATADGNGGPGLAPNGLLDAVELELIGAVLNGSASLPAAADGPDVASIFREVLAATQQDLAPLTASFPSAPLGVAGYLMIGTDASIESIAAMTANFGAPLADATQSKTRELGGLFGPDGDADGDGFTNRQEYVGMIDQGTEAYILAALDPTQTPDAEALEAASRSVSSTERMRVGIVLYPGFEVLDVYGPVEMWGYVPEFELLTIAATAGPIRSTQGLVTIADHSFDSAPEIDLLFVPGGAGMLGLLKDEATLDFLRRRAAAADLTTSVCTGSILLAAAGVLDGHRATSNKLHFSIARATSDAVTWIEEARWVDDGKVVTSSGVSAGIDMALHVVDRLYGTARAEQLAMWTEYIWNRDPTNDPFVGSIRAGSHGDH
ncbi:MAG: DJ-1/PfpI family protein [Acidobacteriota bacterium]